MNRRNFILMASGALAGPVPGSAFAQGYPSRPIRIVVPYPPGGPLDLAARLVGAHMATQFSAPVVVENKPGAGGDIGVQLVASAPADGYTLLLSGPNITISPLLLNSTARFNPIESFDHLGRLVTASTLLTVRADSPHTDLRSFLAAARQSNGSLTYGVPGIGSPSHIAMEMLNGAAGVNIRAVPYRGVANAITDLIGGSIDCLPAVSAGVMPQIKSGRLRALAVTSLKRDPKLPGVMAVAELFPGFEALTWLGLSVPKATPPEIQKTLSSALQKAISSPEVGEKFIASGMEPNWLNADMTTRMIAKESELYSRVIRDAKISTA